MTIERSILLLRGIGIGAIIIGFIGLLRALFPVISSELNYEITRAISSEVTPTPFQGGFGEILLIAPPLTVIPMNTTNSLIIPDIDVNAPIVWDIPVIDETAYNAALKQGIAHAEGTKHPSQDAGNTYLFAHSTLNPLDIQRYSAVFTLLHRLAEGTRITLFSDTIRYDYIVETKEVVRDFDVTPLTREPDYPMLTLQTCDPPGIPINRLIITARLVGVYDAK